MPNQIGLPLDKTFIKALGVWAHISGVSKGEEYTPRQITHPMTCAVIAQALYFMGAIEKRRINYLEIGTRNGASMALASRFTKGELVGVDPMETLSSINPSSEYMPNHSHGWREKFWQTVDEYDFRDRCTLHEVSSVPFPDLGDIRFGVGFIDGDHSYEFASADAESMMEVVDGFIIFDDVDQKDNAQRDGPYRAMLEAVEHPDWRLGYFSGRTGVIINENHSESEVFGHLLGPALYSVQQSAGIQQPVSVLGFKEEDDAEV